MAALVDTHCHLNFAAFADDLPALLKRAKQARVERIIAPAIDHESCAEVLDLASRHHGIFCALGIHPNSANQATDETLSRIRQRAEMPQVVAIGEIGLDYHWDRFPRARQIKAFETQLALAAELALPVIIHNREATGDVLDALAAWQPTLPHGLRDRPGVLHSFSGTAIDAERALDLGFFLGFTGPITFKKAEATRAAAAATPIDRLLVETDAPFLTPHPYRGKRNEPAHVALVNARLATLHGISADAMATATSANAERLFRLDATASAPLSDAPA